MEMRKEMEKEYVMITGASGHLGGAFALEQALAGENVILTGRSEEKLLQKKQELLAKGATGEIRCYACDLSKDNSRCEMMDKIRADGLILKRLINVAGADIQKAFEQYTQEKILFQCRVNFEAAVSLCRFAIERKGENLEIVNISSVSGIYPMPYFAIYSAAKGALTSFSLSLREEMKKKGVKVTAVLPGAMPTRDDIKEQIKGQGLWGKLAAKSPEFVVKKSLKAVRKNKGKYIPGFWNRVMNVGTKLVPLKLKLKFIAKRWSKISKDAF